MNDIKDVHVADGRLKITITGRDAFFTLPPVSAPLDGCVVRLRMRSNLDGYTQIYWQTQAAAEFTEQRQMSRELYLALRPETDRGQFVTVDFPIGAPQDAGQTLTRFRIDPFNNNASGSLEIAGIELLRQPPLIAARVATASHWVEVGESTAVQAVLRQTGGAAAAEHWAVQMVSPEPGQTAQLRPDRRPQPIDSVKSDRPGVHVLRARITSSESDGPWDIEQAFVVGRGPHLPLTDALRGENTRLDFVPMHDKGGIGAARWQVHTADGRWLHAGMLLPLAELTIQNAQGGIVRTLPRWRIQKTTADQIILEGTATVDGDWRCAIAFQLDRRERTEFIRVRCTLTGPAGGRLLNFTGPVLRVDRDPPSADVLDRHALFGGLEFLEPGWASSSERAVGPRFADRWTPATHKITLPMMAVAEAGVCSTLIWDPLQNWSRTRHGPAATFASPNFLDGQANHLMCLSLPGVGVGREENDDLARSPFVMNADDPLTIEYVLLADERADVRTVARRWYEVFGAPLPPPAPHDDATTYALLARHLGETLWDQDAKGWVSHWYMKSTPHFNGWAASKLVAHALLSGDAQWITKTGLTDRALIDAAGTLTKAASHLGPARALAADMRLDGTWPYADAPKARNLTTQLTEGQFDSLGEAGTTSLGTCAQPALSILRQAVLTGDDGLIRAGLRALEAMKQFHVPRGAQVWEVHKDIPDIRGAALAIEAFQLGYRLTGDERYLDEANAWAWSGVPFVYAWRVPVAPGKGTLIASREREGQAVPMPLSEGFIQPDRQVTPYGTVPVLGPTAYVVNWFGVIVQWCGLEWAWKTIELDKDRPDSLLRYIANGVVRSGLQQMFDRPPWVGLYPDVWFVDEHRACGAFIWCQLPMQCLESQGRLPDLSRSWSRTLPAPDGTERWHVSGWGRPVSLRTPGRGPWGATLEFIPGQPNELVLARVPQPRIVLIDGQPLKALDGAKVNAADAGWHYDAAGRIVFVRFEQPAATCKLRILW